MKYILSVTRLTVCIQALMYSLLVPFVAVAEEPDRAQDSERWQEIAESALHSPRNENAVRRLSARTLHLVAKVEKIRASTTALGARSAAVSGAKTDVDGALQRLKAESTSTETRIVLPSSVLFDFDSANLRPDAEEALADVTSIIRARGSRGVFVDGHTDEIGTNDYNLALSRRRAAAVAEFVSAGGVQKSVLITRPFGEERPIDTNATAEGRQKNRRVEIVIPKGKP